MKKILLLLFLPIFVFPSCSDTDDGFEPNHEPEPDGEQEEKKNPYKTGVDMSSSTFFKWDNTGINDQYFMLGYGYDVTGKYAHPSSVRNKVIDMDKYSKDTYGEITFFQSTSSGPELSIGGTQRKCIETMGERAGFDKNEISKYKNLFKGTFDSPFKNDSSFPNLSYSYIGISQVHVLYHLYFFYSSSSSRLQERFQSRYLTDEFQADIETISSDEIIKKYGTHVLNSIKIGERMDYLYRYAEDTNSNSYNWFLYNMHQYFSQGPSAWGSKPGKNPPLKENMHIEAVDGTRPNPNVWMIDITNFQGGKIVFNAWDNVTDSNLTLVAFRNDDCLIPIYEFIKNPNKKEELTKVYEKYLSE